MTAPTLADVNPGDSVTLVNAATPKGARYVVGVFPVLRTTPATVWIADGSSLGTGYARANGRRRGDVNAPVYLRPTIPGDVERAEANRLRLRAEDARNTAAREARYAAQAKLDAAAHRRHADDAERTETMHAERAREQTDDAARLETEADAIERGLDAGASS